MTHGEMHGETSAAAPARGGRAARRLRARYGPWAVVTGASSGIGREIARGLAKAGFDLVLVARGRDALEELAAELERTHAVGTRVLALDLAAPGGAEEVEEATRALDVGLLVAAAGFGTSGRLVDAPLESEREMLAVNCGAVLALVHGFGRRFRARGGGGIVLLGSLLGFQGTPFAANYAATKAYVQSLAEGLALELRPAGVNVFCSAPGPTHSGFAARAGMRMGLAQSARSVARATLARMGRPGTIHPGALTRLLTWSLAPLPRAARVRIMGRIMAGMTGTSSGPA
jgi:hypothetical protein